MGSRPIARFFSLVRQRPARSDRLAREERRGAHSIVVDWMDVSGHRCYRRNYSIQRGIDLLGRIRGSLKTTDV